MLRFVYSLIWYLLLPFIFLKLWVRSRLAPAYRKRWAERLGFYNIKIDEPVIWIHAVSLGEVIAITPVVKKLLDQHETVLITTMTPTGSMQVKKTFQTQVAHVYLPYDFPGAIKRFLACFTPKIFVMVETELWPNLLHYVHKKNSPILLANARLSEKSAAGYARIHKMTQKMLNNIDHIAAQTPQDAERFFALGFRDEKLSVLGNIKYDLSIEPSIWEQAKSLKNEIGARPIFLAASTHEGEDEIVMNVFATLRHDFPNLLLILVPRHPERFANVFALCQEKFITQKRSLKQPIENKTDILLGDTLGELLVFYALCDIAFVGGSFVATGGHNLIEPASLAKPIVTGPHLFNFSDVSAQLIAAHGMQVANDEQEMNDIVKNLLKNPDLCDEMGQNAQSVAKQNRGAVDRLCWLIQSMISHGI